MQKVKHKVGKVFPALKSSNFRLYFAGQGISLIGTWFASVAQQWLIYPTLTHNQSMLGIVSAVNLLPTALLILIAGVYADKVNKRNFVIILQALFAVISFAIAFLIFSGMIQIWHVLVASVIGGILFSFDMPTRTALVTDMVEKKDMASAISLSSGMFNAARAIGPAIAGVLIAVTGIAFAYVVDATSFVAVIISLFLLKIPPYTVQPHHGQSLKEGFAEGLSYIRSHTEIIFILLLVAILTIATWPTAVLLPVFANDVYKQGEVGFGLLQSVYGIGAMIGAFGFSMLFDRIKHVYTFILVLISILGGSYILFALSPSFILALFVYTISGWGMATFYSTCGIMLQMDVPNHLRGRITSFYSFMIFGAMPIASMGTSLIVPYLHARNTSLVVPIGGALVTLLIIYLIERRSPGQLALKLDKLAGRKQPMDVTELV
jgi:MFS family permease